MKLIKFIAIIIIFPNIALSQVNMDSLMTETAPNCENIAYNSTKLIEKYYNNSKIDSAIMVLNYWENKCGINEPIIRIKILFSILQNSFNENLYDTTILNYMYQYESRVSRKQQAYYYEYYKPSFGYVPINGDFDKFTYKLANNLKDKQDKNTLEYLFCKFYTDNFDYFYSEIQKNSNFNNSAIRTNYYKIVDEYINMPEFHWNFFTGIWIPTNNTALLGNHYHLGFKGGVLYKKWTCNLSLYFKFGNSLNEYEVLYSDTILKTNHFFGGYFGLDFERQLISFKGNRIYISAGVGWDGFDAIDVDINDNNPYNDEGISINSLNLNSGLIYRYQFKNNNYIGLSGTFNYVNYKNLGGTNFSGNTYTISLSFGGFSNQIKNYNLKSLRYIR